jgi:hypothetical protein
MGLCTSREARPARLEWKRRPENVARRNNEDRGPRRDKFGVVKGQQMACCRGEGEAVEGVCAGRLALAEDERRDRLTSGAAMRAVVF